MNNILDLGVSKAGKACEKPAKGGFRNVVSPEIGGCFQREGTSIMRTLKNTEWGEGGWGRGQESVA